MALNIIEDLTAKSSADLPTINEWEKQASPKDNDSFAIIRVKRTSKCLVVETTEFVGFIWNSDKLANQLIQAILHYMAEEPGYELRAVYMKKLKRKFTIAVDDESESSWEYHDDESFTQRGKSSYVNSPPPPPEDNPLIKAKKTPRRVQTELPL